MSDVADSDYIQAAIDQGTAMQELSDKQWWWDLALLLASITLKTQISDLQVELLDELMDLAEETQKHWRKYRPFEQALIDEVLSYTPYCPQYTATTNLFNGLAEDSFAANHDDYLDYLNMRCNTPQTECEDALWDNALGLFRVDVQAYGMRWEEWKRFSEDAKHFSRRLGVARLGKGVAGDVLTTLKSALRSQPADIWGALFEVGRRIFSAPPSRPRVMPVAPRATAQFYIEQPSPIMPAVTPSPETTPVNIEQNTETQMGHMSPDRGAPQ